MAELRGLIYDVDGTLALNEQEGHRVAFNMAFGELGLDWHWDEALYARLLEVFGGKERLRYFIDDFAADFTPPADLDAFVREVHVRKTEQYLRLLEQGRLPLRPGVARLIREAHAAGLHQAIASTTTLANATTLLARALGPESVDWFDVFACGDVVPNKKPAPDIYFYALEHMGLQAAECLVIEDTESGLASALGAGITTLITVNPTTREQDFSGAAIVLDGLGEPGEPFSVLSGDAGSAHYVDVAFLRNLHARAIQPL